MTESWYSARAGVVTCVLAWALTSAAAAAAGQIASPAAEPPRTTLARSDGPVAPEPPSVVTRDETGHVTVRAVRVPSLRIDGRLDEEVYAAVPGIGGFVQIEPDEGAPATQPTELWVLFDRENVYLSARVHEAFLDRMVADEMRHDAVNTLGQNEVLTIAFDTFNDRRNGYSFTISPIGGRAEGQFTNERQYSGDWNGIWDVKVGRFDKGWTVEMAVPFKSLRYNPGEEQTWGFQVMRTNRWKNELTFLTPMPAARGSSAFMQISLAATLVGIEAPPPARNLEIKPYGVADLTTDRAITPRLENELGADAGVDLKYGIGQGLALDVTVNTDFAQVEADEQQVNLTRFNLFFPEKRDFFLENQGIFTFGGGGSGAGGDTPTLFYSRRIGLAGTREVPILAGGRLTGRAGRYTIGGLNIQTRAEAARPLAATAVTAPSTNFSALRIKRDILRRSSVGVLTTSRSDSERGSGSNQTVGADATLAFFANLTINAYVAETRTPGLGSDTGAGDELSYRTQLDYGGDRYGVQVERLHVGEFFNPEVGFVRRYNIRKNYGYFRFSPRPRQPSMVRKYTWQASANDIRNDAGRVEQQDLSGDFIIEFQSSDRLSAGYSRIHEFIPAAFQIAPGVVVPVGPYDYEFGRASFTFGQQRRASGTLSVERGTLYGGDRTTIALRTGRVKVTPQFALEPTISINRVALPLARPFQNNLAGSRITYSMTPLMFVTALVQDSSQSHSVATNLRFRWEYRPGSELFVVYNDTQATSGSALTGLVNRALIVKTTTLLRF